MSAIVSDRKVRLSRRIWNARYIYLFLLPGLAVLTVFRYGSMPGVLLAFKKYRATLGIWGSEWVGLTHFQRLFNTPNAVSAVWTTLEISLGRLLLCFPAPILLALLINEMPLRRTGRVYQVIYTFPHFLSWVIVAGMIRTLFKNNGAINELLGLMGLESVNFLGSTRVFRIMLYATDIWKGAGYSCILYLAAISSIDPGLYEAARLDGAGRFQCMWHVTLPGMAGVISITLILAISGMMNGGFDQIFNLRNPVVAKSAQIIDTYVYDITFAATPDYGFSTAVGLFKSVINCMLLVLANVCVKRISGQSIYGGD
ncbi:MAG: ABC transporter permease [Aristaeellaceae bacterium]